MRWRRAVVFAAIVVAHFLLVWLFPSGNGAQESVERDISFATLLVPERNAEQTPRAVPSQRAPRTAQASRISHAKAVGDSPRQSDTEQPPSTTPAFIDWVHEAQIAADGRITSDAATSTRARAFSAWKSRVMPPPGVPPAPKFEWDYAATHRFESSPKGLTINLNDRCSVLITLSLMAIIGGCKIGELPVHGDLFSQMRDVPALPND